VLSKVWSTGGSYNCGTLFFWIFRVFIRILIDSVATGISEHDSGHRWSQDFGSLILN
jgi:hypothetical protein